MSERAIKRNMMKQEIKERAKAMGVSMKILKKWFSLKGRRLSLSNKLDLLNNIGGK